MSGSAVGPAAFAKNGKKIVAILRNYYNHCREMGSTVPSKPTFFLKPTTSYVEEGGAIEVPEGVEVHHEVELAVVIGKRGRDIPRSKAMDYVAGYAIALDMTARNLQAEAKKNGMPWSASKGYDTFAPVGSFISREKIADPHRLNLWLKVNGTLRQQDSTADMIFNIPHMIEEASRVFTLEEGDVFLTGTPAGVGAVNPGDVVTAGIEGIAEIKFPVVARPAPASE